MNIQRFNSIYEGLTEVCRKVYQVVPIQEAWTVQQIKSEASRQAVGITRDVHAFAGCLNTLVRCGLVSESPKGCFKRTKVTAKVATTGQEAQEKEMQNTTQTTPSTKPASAVSTIDRLAVLALQLKGLAAELETAAIEIEEQNAVNAEGRKKLEQLQALLKGVA